MTTALAQAAKAVPAYCSSGHGVLTPAQWKTCWDAGWSQPVTNTASFGHAVGGNVLPVVIFGAVILLVLALAGRTRSRTPAAGKS